METTGDTGNVQIDSTNLVMLLIRGDVGVEGGG